jgi:putative sterol carrier protein
MTVEETLQNIMDRFNRRAAQNPAVAEELHGLERTVAVRLKDGGTYSVELRDGRLQNLRSGAPSKADLTIATDSETFRGLVAKEIGPMKALVTRKLTIEGSLEDNLLFRKLLG